MRLVLVPEDLIGLCIKAGGCMSGKKKDIPQSNIQIADHGSHGLVNYDGNAIIFADQGMQDAYVEVRYLHIISLGSAVVVNRL